MGFSKILSAVILATVLATFANSSECPVLQNCLCEDKATGGFSIRCYGDKESGPSYIREFKILLQETFPNKTELDLHFENFRKPTNLDSKIFDGLRVRKLTFVNCHGIDRWADNLGGPAFVGLEDTLEELEVEDSFKLRYGHGAPFNLGHIRWLKKVSFFRNKMYSFGDDWFDKPRTLEELDLSGNEIQDLDSYAFNHMVNLRVLNLANNKIKQPAYPHHSRKLEKINLRGNKLPWIPRYFFQGHPDLKEIDISYNPIRYLTEAEMGNLWSQLDFLDISETYLHCDETINWMIHQMKGPKILLGACATPADVAGKQLRKVIAQRRIDGV